MAVQAQMYPENLGIMPLSGSQGWGGGGGGGGGGLMTADALGYNLKHPQHSQQHRQQYVVDSANSFLFSAPGSTRSITSQIEKQSQEIDKFINPHSQRLKSVLQEQRNQGLLALIGKLDAKAGILLRQKDEEIAQAKRRALELEDFMKRLEMENQSWKKLAGENESMIINLNRTISVKQQEQRKLQEPMSKGAVDDAESCCNVNNGGREGEEEGGRMGRECRLCGYRKSSVLLLPCRHLCCCTSCDAFLDSCPVCNSPKKATIQVLFS